jgi:tetratricopeptide (TPR) repeat protein
MKKILFAILIIGLLILIYLLIPKSGFHKENTTPPMTTPTPSVASQPATPPTSGTSLFDQGKYKDAIAQLIEELNAPGQDNPDRCLTYLALSYEKNGNHNDAVKTWNRLITEHPNSVYCGDGYYELGRSSENRPDKIQFLEKAMKYPDSKGAKAAGVELGDYYLSQKDIPDFEYKARQAYSLALQSNISKEKSAEIKAKLALLNKKLVFSPFATPDSTIYTVQPGDNLSKISKTYKVEPGSGTKALGHIRRINNKSSAAIFPGDRLKIITAPMWVKVSKRNCTLDLYFNNDFIKEYSIGIGDATKNNETPAGTFTINAKVVEPPWYGRTKDGKKEVIPYGDPRNVLGTRWMSFKESPQLGIHGTSDPTSIGQKVSNGCVRMRNEDVEELYDLLPPGSKIVIEE